MDRLKELLPEGHPWLSPIKVGAHGMPGIWIDLFPRDLSQLQIPAERQATCANCPKICSDAYRPDYRCCTYHPKVANFLLGLATETAEGNRAVDRLVKRGMLLPLGMQASPAQWLDFIADQDEDRYGKSQRVLCPLLDTKSGRCSIYAFRNAVCSTFFCISDQGQAGRDFWAEIQTYGSQIELALAQWSLEKAGFDLNAYFQRLNSLNPELASADMGWDEDVLEDLWGEWFGREKELMRACAVALAEHRNELREIAQNWKIREAQEFEKAMDRMIDTEDEAEAEELEDLVEEPQFDLQESWQNVVEAEAKIWELPEGFYRLSPHLHIADGYLEYRYAEGSPLKNWQKPISADQKNLLEKLRRGPFTLGDGPDPFFSEMLNRKVFWPYRPAVEAES